MAQAYRNKNDKKPDLKRTVSSTSDNPELNKALQTTRRTDDIQSPNIGIYDIDTAFKHFLENGIKPTVEENGTFVPVPVLYATPENWVSAQRDGYLRDEKGKAITPLISFKRDSIDKNTEYSKLKLITDSNYTSKTFVRKYTQENKYDPFSVLNGTLPVEERYLIEMPEYVDVSYNVIIWCDYMQQLNKLVEQIIYFEGNTFGDRYRFTIKANSYSFENTNGIGEERIVRCNLSLTSKAYLLPEFRAGVATTQKSFSKSKVVWNIKTN
jgi:hypothetical protein